MTRSTPTLAIALVVALLAGCIADDAGGEPEAAVAASAQEAGAVAGSAPEAAQRPFHVAAGEDDAGAVTVYPLTFETNGAKAQVVEEFTGTFEPQQCLPTGGGLPLGGLGLAEGGEMFPLGDAFATGDVFSYDITMTFTNTDSSWAELHLWHRFDSVSDYWEEPTSDKRGEVVLNFTGQGYIVSEEFFAAVGVDCWYGFVTSPIPYTISVTITFAQGAIPAAQPVLVRVPEGATRLFVSGLALDESRGVTSHYRVFAPDDTLLCECALNSNEPVGVLELAQAGDHVVLVDHTENGFVALGLDVAPEAPARALGTRSLQIPLAQSDGGAVDTALQVDIPSTPLGVWAWVFAPGDIGGAPDAGAGKDVRIVVSNARGDVTRFAMVGYATYHAAVPGAFVTNEWYAVPLPGDWEFYRDHHAFDLGAHTVTVKAEAMRGQAMLFVQLYDRG